MHDHRLNEAEADEGLGLSDSPLLEPATGGGHEIPHPPELQSQLPLSTPTPPPARSPGRTVRELAHKLSQQNLRRGEGSTGTDQPHPSPQQLSASTSAPEPTSISQPPPPIPVTAQALASLPDYSTPEPWPTSLEVDDEPEAAQDTSKHDPPYLSLLSVVRRRSQFFRGESSSTGAGGASGARSTEARLRKQMSTQFRDKTATTNTARVEQMISNGTQCNVQNAPSPAPTPTSAPTTSAAPSKPDTNNLDYVYSPMELEVDEAYCNGKEGDSFEEDLSFVESVVSLRRAGAPGGIRKQIVNGITLRYQLSADAALRCQTVVKNRPRMRRRKTTRADSIASSAATSAISSPVIPPSIPSPHIHPYE